MSTLRTSLLTATIVTATLVPAVAAQAAPTTFPASQAPTRVAAWEGTVMWSSFDAATKTYSLVKSVDGRAPVPAGVAPRRGAPFDIDLGTNRSGATFAVYTRDGDIYRLDVATGAEAKIAKLSSPSLAERDPTIQRGRIAFIRRAAGFDQLRIGDTTTASRGSRLVVRKRSIVSAELGVRHVAYVESVPAEFRELHVRIRNLRTGADRQVYRAASGGANGAGVTRPTYVATPEGFLWARTNNGMSGSRLVRYTLSGSKLGYAPGSPFYNSTAWAGDALGAATATSIDTSDSQGACTDAGATYCAVGLTGPLRFNLEP